MHVDAQDRLWIADAGNNWVRMVGTDGIIQTMAGGNDGDGVAAVRAELKGPEDVVVDRQRFLYIVDSQHNRIRRVNPDDNLITTIAGTGTAGFSGDGGPAPEAKLDGPTGLTVLDDRTVFFIDANSVRIRRIDPSGTISTIAGNGVSGFSVDGGSAILAQFDRPSGIDVGPDGSVYVANRNNHRIRRVGIDGIITTVVGSEGRVIRVMEVLL